MIKYEFVLEISHLQDYFPLPFDKNEYPHAILSVPGVFTLSRGTQSRYKNKVNLKYLQMYNVIIKHKLCLNFLIPF